MFQFRRFPTYAYLIQRRLTEYCSAGFPHSEISGSTVICTSPKLIAACHVLHRLLMPRHSPCALLRLTFLSCCQEGLALVLKRLNYAGSEFFEIVCVTLFEKFHKSFLFPSVACSSYLVTLFSFQGAFPASFETRSKHSISLNACIQSRTISLGPVPDGTRGVPRTSVLAKPKPCRRGNSFAPRMSYPLWGSPFDGNQMGWWAQVDSNHRPHDYQSCALAS